jgi:hypothetical protein
LIYLAFCAINFQFTIIVPGILEVTDLGEIVASIAPRPVLLEKPVNGLNKKVPLSIMEIE